VTDWQFGDAVARSRDARRTAHEVRSESAAVRIESRWLVKESKALRIRLAADRSRRS